MWTIENANQMHQSLNIQHDRWKERFTSVWNNERQHRSLSSHLIANFLLWHLHLQIENFHPIEVIKFPTTRPNDFHIWWTATSWYLHYNKRFCGKMTARNNTWSETHTHSKVNPLFWFDCSLRFYISTTCVDLNSLLFFVHPHVWRVF